jgi:hypothetical protein
MGSTAKAMLLSWPILQRVERLNSASSRTLRFQHSSASENQIQADPESLRIDRCVSGSAISASRWLAPVLTQSTCVPAAHLSVGLLVHGSAMSYTIRIVCFTIQHVHLTSSAVTRQRNCHSSCSSSVNILSNQKRISCRAVEAP